MNIKYMLNVFHSLSSIRAEVMEEQSASPGGNTDNGSQRNGEEVTQGLILIAFACIAFGVNELGMLLLINYSSLSVGQY